MVWAGILLEMESAWMGEFLCRNHFNLEDGASRSSTQLTAIRCKNIFLFRHYVHLYPMISDSLERNTYLWKTVLSWIWDCWIHLAATLLRTSKYIVMFSKCKILFKGIHFYVTFCISCTTASRIHTSSMVTEHPGLVGCDAVSVGE